MKHAVRFVDLTSSELFKRAPRAATRIEVAEKAPLHYWLLSNLLSARSLLSHSIEDAARYGPCAHGNIGCIAAARRARRA